MLRSVAGQIQKASGNAQSSAVPLLLRVAAAATGYAGVLQQCAWHGTAGRLCQPVRLAWLPIKAGAGVLSVGGGRRSSLCLYMPLAPV